MLVRSAAVWAFTLLTLAARSQAYQSVIRMRNNCTLIVNQAPTEEEPLVTQALANIASTLGVNNTGLMERAYYASAYVDPETLQYRDGANDTNILRSAATVSANDTRVLITSPTSLNYSNLDLALFANNTLDLHNTKVKLNQSTVSLDHDNWVHLNNSTLNLYSTKFNFTNFFTWWAEASNVYAKTSVLNLENILTWWTGSNVKVEYSTFNITSENATAPANYEQLFPVLWINDSAVNVSSTEWMIRGLPLVNVLNSSLGLYNSTLTLKDTEAHFESSFLDIYRSTLLCDNSTILIHEGVKTKYNVTAVQGPNSTNVTAGNDLVGHPLGTVDGTLGGEDIDITLNSMT